MFSTTVPTVALAVSIFVLYSVARRRLYKRPPYPPGPAPSLIIGNLLDTPLTEAWLTYVKWGSLYGDIIHFTILGAHIVVLNSLDDIREMFEKRSNLYSDRPHMATIDLMGWGESTAFLPYGRELRKHRQFSQQAIIKHSSLSGFMPIVTKKVNILLHSLLTTPDDFMKHHKTFAASVVMAIVYGYDVTGADDHFIVIADETMELLTEAMLPGASMMNVLPILRFIPAWFPGATIQRLAVLGRKLGKEMREVPFDMVQKQTAEGTAAPSLVSNFIKEAKSTEDYDFLKQACASLYGAGTDTTATALTTYFHAMIAYPDVQAKAQRELENVIGNDRLPNFDDRPSLPYIEALLKELLRWRPVLPLCLPHSTREDDIYKGYFIPKGTAILANIWAIYHDPRQYKDPHILDPSRFLDERGQLKEDNSEAHAFGFGRRFCPGKHLASNSLWLSIACILAAFDIQAPKNGTGVRVLPVMHYTDAMIPASVSQVIEGLQQIRK